MNLISNLERTGPASRGSLSSCLPLLTVSSSLDGSANSIVDAMPSKIKRRPGVGVGAVGVTGAGAADGGEVVVPGDDAGGKVVADDDEGGDVVTDDPEGDAIVGVTGADEKAVQLPIEVEQFTPWVIRQDARLPNSLKHGTVLVVLVSP